MSKRRSFWFKWHPKDALDGMMQLSPWAELAYRRIIDMIYTSGNKLEDDDESLVWSTKCGTHWEAAKRELVKKGKIYVLDGLIRNKKCDDVLKEVAAYRAARSRAGLASAEARNPLGKKKPVVTPVDDVLQHKGNQSTDTVREEERKKEPSLSERGSDDVVPIDRGAGRDEPRAMAAIWNKFALENGLPQVAKLNDARRASARRRLAEAGGMDGWAAAVKRVGRSPFLLGENDKGWRASFDFMLQVKSFTKLVEGTYDDMGAQHKAFRM